MVFEVVRMDEMINESEVRHKLRIDHEWKWRHKEGQDETFMNVNI